MSQKSFIFIAWSMEQGAWSRGHGAGGRGQRAARPAAGFDRRGIIYKMQVNSNKMFHEKIKEH